MLRIYDAGNNVYCEVDGPWLHPVLWLFGEDAGDVRAFLRDERGASVFDTVVGSAALSCYRRLGVRRVFAELSDRTAGDLAASWDIALAAERTVEAIDCASEGDVERIAAENGGLPDPDRVLEMLRRRAAANPRDVRVQRFRTSA